jgi:hypothetical protein
MRIVDTLESLDSRAVSMTREVMVNLAKAGVLRRAILRDAFSGKLASIGIVTEKPTLVGQIA